jgi:methylenetetrahydrofolate reductase (NADPH)
MSEPVAISLEFFPPKSDEAEKSLWAAMRKLEALLPRFVSVTYGAGGSTQDRTTGIVRSLAAEGRVKPAAHLTCVGRTAAEVDAVADAWWDAGITHIVALRGDAPAGSTGYTPHPQGYENARALTAGLRARHPFEISVAAYPEKHPDSPSLDACLDNLKAKIDAGATRALTQFFFAPEAFLRYRDLAAAKGITAELVPGILPITNFKSAASFAERCGAQVPAALVEKFAGLDEKSAAYQDAALEASVDLCRQLMQEGVNAFHFYTLNRSALTLAVCDALQIAPPTPAQ